MSESRCGTCGAADRQHEAGCAELARNLDLMTRDWPTCPQCSQRWNDALFDACPHCIEAARQEWLAAERERAARLARAACVSRLTTHDIAREITYRVPEHEVLLSFNGDVGAYAFHTWWQDHGEAAFRAWVDSDPEGIERLHG